MIVTGGETVTVVGECRFCGEEASGRLGTKCEACDRQRHRLSKVVSPALLRGLTTCCGLLPHVARGRYYCAACPGAGKVAVVLVCGSREVTAYHDRRAPCPGGDLDAVARRRGVRVDELVLEVSVRDFGLRRVRSATPVDRTSDTVTVVFNCTGCKRSTEKKVKSRAATKKNLRCEPCLRRRANKNKKAWQRRLVLITCTNCEQRRVPTSATSGLCGRCFERRAQNGTCGTCGKIRRKRRGGAPVCATCQPVWQQRRDPTVTVTITDGVVFRDVHVTTSAYCAGGSAGAWIAPVLLVDDPHSLKPGIRNATPVSGIYVHHTGPASRALLGAIEKHGAATFDECQAITRAELEWESGRVCLLRLRRAGLINKRGLTARGRAVLAWCRSAGVKL